MPFANLNARDLCEVFINDTWHPATVVSTSASAATIDCPAFTTGGTSIFEISDATLLRSAKALALRLCSDWTGRLLTSAARAICSTSMRRATRENSAAMRGTSGGSRCSSMSLDTIASKLAFVKGRLVAGAA